MPAHGNPMTGPGRQQVNFIIELCFQLQLPVQYKVLYTGNEEFLHWPLI